MLLPFITLQSLPIHSNVSLILLSPCISLHLPVRMLVLIHRGFQPISIALGHLNAADAGQIACLSGSEGSVFARL